jgi:putative copper resistance protein D
MLALIIVAARLGQFGGAMALSGGPLFFVYGLPADGVGAASELRWPRPLLGAAAIVIAVAAAVSLSAQTAVMSGRDADAFRPSVLASVVTGTPFGLWTAARAGLAMVAALALAATKPSRRLWLVAAALGAGVLVSFAWTGHATADDGLAGLVHLTGDVAHLLAAGVWIGALAVLSILLASARASGSKAELAALHGGLEGFSGIGAGVVAVLLASGVVNSWFLIGPSHLGQVLTTAYGLILTAKVGLFAAMLGLATANRFRLAPRLARALGSDDAIAAAIRVLRRSVLIETGLAVAVLVLVSVLGTAEPPASQ